jgi:hypothetical protein
VASQKLRMPEFEEGVVLRSSLPHNSDQKVATFLGLAPEHVQTSGSRNLAVSLRSLHVIPTVARTLYSKHSWSLTAPHLSTSQRQVIPELEHRLELKVTSLLEIARRDGGRNSSIMLYHQVPEGSFIRC